jgi:5'-nucleotidase
LHILLTNDDGFYAEGLQTLYSYLKTTTRVTIIAPDHERSAVSHGITMHQPLRAFPVDMDGLKHWMINGTPADCVKLGLEHLLRSDPPALIISGINRGSNLGSDVLYSGTVSGAIEGALHHIPSIAASLVVFGKADFNHAASFIGENLLKLQKLSFRATLNLNFPATGQATETVDPASNQRLNPFNGIKYTKLGIRLYQNVFEERIDPRGQAYYWMSGEPMTVEQEPDSDIAAIEAGFVSVTPLNPDLTDRCFFDKNSTAMF